MDRKNWFSNFNAYPRPITDRTSGITYRTPEHLYQAAKTLDLTQRKAIAALPTPGQAKRLGKTVTLRPDWEEIKLSVMVYCQKKMVEQDSTYANRLLNSSDEELIEWNHWHDNTWGQCTCTRCKGKPSQNLLQKALIQVRDEMF